MNDAINPSLARVDSEGRRVPLMRMGGKQMYIRRSRQPTITFPRLFHLLPPAPNSALAVGLP